MVPAITRLVPSPNPIPSNDHVLVLRKKIEDMLRSTIGLLTLVAASAVPAAAGQFNGVMNLGDAAPAWTNLAGVDGKKHSLADLKDKEIVVVVFTCNSCPVAVLYEDRIIDFAKKHAGKAAGGAST